MSAWQEKHFTVRGRRIAAKCWHDANKPPLLALHGWLDNANTFDRVAPLLSAYHIVALDFAGHGHSDPLSAGVRYGFLDNVDDVYAVVRQLGWERFFLMGHSMGAGVSVCLSGACPELVEKLVLIEGFGPLSATPEEGPALLRTALDEWAGFQDGPRVFQSLALASKARQGGMSPLSEAAADILCERGVKAVADGFVWATDKRLRLRSPARLTEPQVLSLIAAITAPTLLLRGENGLPFDRGQYRARLDAHRQLATVTLPGRHHLHLDESPEAVAEAVRHFLA